MMIKHQVTIPESASGLRLIPALIAAVPQLTSGQVYKALRKKDVRINGKRVTADQPVEPGDLIELFLPETGGADTANDLETPGATASAGAPPAGTKTAGAKSARSSIPFSIVYSDKQVVILNKIAGIAVHGGSEAGPGDDETLIALVRTHLDDPKLTLCHRLDRNTGGLIILARSTEIQREVEDLMKNRLIIKRYRCLVRGEPLSGSAVRTEDNGKFWQLESFLEKRARQNEVYIHDEEKPGDVPVITRYRILRRFPEFGPNAETVSELEVELVTGRTHQIRAHLAHFGHPVLGDGKYGRNSYNRHFKARKGSMTHQQLFACQLIFSPDIKKGPLADLAGRTFKIEPAYDIDLP